LKKALTDRAIGIRTPNSWTESAPSLDDIEALLQSPKDSDLKTVEDALTTNVADGSLKFVAM
jgi:hypothetical protein